MTEIYKEKIRIIEKVCFFKINIYENRNFAVKVSNCQDGALIAIVPKTSVEFFAGWEYNYNWDNKNTKVNSIVLKSVYMLSLK